MIQRIQSIYLLMAAVFSGIIVLFLPLFEIKDRSAAVYVMEDPTFFAMFLLSTLISLFSIFRYRNRKQQVVSGRINIIINFVLLGLMVYTYFEAYKDNGGTMGFGAFIPLVVVIFVSLANRAIMRDEALVRSADRLR